MFNDRKISGCRVAVVGWGLATPLGDGAWSTFRALLEGKTLLDGVERMPSDVDPVALVKAVGTAKGAQGISIDPGIELAERAAREALQMAGVTADQCLPLLATSKGALSALSDAVCVARQNRLRPTVELNNDVERALAVALGPCGYMTHHLGRRLGTLPAQHVVAACSSSLTALHQARLMLTEGAGGLRRVLVVTAEAALLPICIYSYQRLGVLPPLTVQGYRGLPLDVRRCGFVPAEQSAAVVLEAVDDVDPCGSIELVDTAVASEAHDLIRSDPAMPGLRSVAKRLLSRRRIDLVHPHATGTQAHDPSELAVLADSVRLAGQVDVYANKGAIGHGLGASGLASFVIACMCGRAQRRPPMPWLHEPLDPGSEFVSIRAKAAARPITTQAVLAAGFGGHVAGAVLRTVV